MVANEIGKIIKTEQLELLNLARNHTVTSCHGNLLIS